MLFIELILFSICFIYVSQSIHWFSATPLVADGHRTYYFQWEGVNNILKYKMYSIFSKKYSVISVLNGFNFNRNPVPSEIGVK